jgi:Tfp pilus assembly protein PilW
MKYTKMAGFTIMELMVGILAMAIIALAVGSMLVYGWNGWRRNMESIEMQRNAMVAMHVLEQRIRNAAMDDIGGFGSQTLTFTDDPNFSASEFSEGSFVKLEAFTADTNDLGGVEVDVTLSTVSGADENEYSITVYPRN